MGNDKTHNLPSTTLALRSCLQSGDRGCGTSQQGFPRGPAHPGTQATSTVQSGSAVTGSRPWTPGVNGLLVAEESKQLPPAMSWFARGWAGG